MSDKIRNITERVNTAARMTQEIADIEYLLDQIKVLTARNLIAWDTSKDKRNSLLPEIYLHNMGVYKQVFGKDYVYIEAVRWLQDRGIID